jgi:hypothetical protein
MKMARTKRAESETNIRYKRALFPKDYMLKPFQCRLDGCRKSYNHASSLDKHKRLHHRVTQNGRILSETEYKLYVNKMTNKKDSTEVKSRLIQVRKNPLKCAPMKPVATKQPRKWYVIESDVESSTSVRSASEVRSPMTSDNEDDSRSAKSPSSHVALAADGSNGCEGELQRAFSPISDDEQSSMSVSSAKATKGEIMRTSTAASNDCVNQVNADIAVINVVDQSLRSALNTSVLVAETSSMARMNSSEVVSFPDLEETAVSTVNCDFGGMFDELLDQSLLLSSTSKTAVVPSISVLNDNDTSAVELNVSNDASTSATTHGKTRSDSFSLTSFASMPLSVVQLHEAARCMPNLSAFDIAAEIQRSLSLPDDKTEQLRTVLSAILFSRAQAFNEVRRLLPTYGAIEDEVRGSVRRIADLVSEADSRPSFRLFEL